MSDRPRWVCGACHAPLTSTDGAVSVPYRELRAKMGLDDTAEREGGELAEQSGYVRWRVLHDRCAPDLGDLYDIEVGRLATWEAVAAWSAHLHGKRWFRLTDWAGLLYAAGIRGVAG